MNSFLTDISIDPIDSIRLILYPIFSIVIGWIIARFDHTYYQNTVIATGDARRYQRTRMWGTTVDIILALIFLSLALGTGLAVFIGKYTPDPLWSFVPIMACSFLMIFFLWPSFRLRLMNLCRLDANRYVHRVFIAWGVMGMVDFILSRHPIMLKKSLATFYQTLQEGKALVSLPCQLISFTALAALVTGLFIHRNWRQFCQRVGLHRKPTGKLLLWVPLLTLLLFVALQGLVELITYTFDIPKPPSLPSVSLPVLLLLGVAPGIGEELLYRGALQPRIGLLGSSLLFTISHLQYSWMVLCTIFLGSLFLGWLARRYGLWASITGHVCHNILVGLVANYG